MKKFKVEIKEISSKTIELLAEDSNEAFKVIDNIYQKYMPLFTKDDIKSKIMKIKNEKDIDSKYLEKLENVNKDFLVSELQESKFYMFEDIALSLFDIGLIKKEEDIILLTYIYYSDYCPNEEDNISFYFKPTRDYAVLNYHDYKKWSIKDLFLLEKKLYSQNINYEKEEDNSYFILKTDIPFQELNSFIIHELVEQKQT